MARFWCFFPLFKWVCSQDLFLEQAPVLDPSAIDEVVNKSINLTKPMQNVQCITNTGGSCAFESCFGWRGPTECSFGRCFCNDGTCSTVDGVCVNGMNNRIQGKIRLRNARYPNHYMYLSTVLTGVYVSRSTNDQSEWNLYQPPTAGLKNRTLEFFLSSRKYNNYVVASEYVCTDSRRGYGVTTCQYEVNSREIQSLGAAGIESLALRLYAPPHHYGEPDGVQSVMLESYLYRDQFLYVDVGSWGVGQWRYDPGAGGYWIVEPPLEGISFQRYDGPPCRRDCGSYGSGTSTQGWIKYIVGLVIVCILCLCLCACEIILKN